MPKKRPATKLSIIRARSGRASRKKQEEAKKKNRPRASSVKRVKVRTFIENGCKVRRRRPGGGYWTVKRYPTRYVVAARTSKAVWMGTTVEQLRNQERLTGRKV